MESIEKVCEIARAAGAAIMHIYAGEFNVELKGDDSPLTCADRASHEVIVAGLQQAFPDIPILSEEGRDIPYAERKDWQRFIPAGLRTRNGSSVLILRTGNY